MAGTKITGPTTLNNLLLLLSRDMSHLARESVGTSQLADRNTLQAKLVPARPARPCKRAQVHCSRLPGLQCDEDKERNTGISGLRAVAVVTAVAQVLAAGEAHAWDHNWKPRRHHKRMNERPVNVKQFFQVRHLRVHAVTHADALRQHEVCVCCQFSRRTTSMNAWRPAHNTFSNRCSTSTIHTVSWPYAAHSVTAAH